MRIESVQRLKPLTAPQGCISFTGFFNLCLFCSELQKLLKPIYDLTRKRRAFDWDTEQEEAFDEIKRWLQKPEVLYMPYNEGSIQFYSDTSKFALVVHYTKFILDNQGL